MALIPFENRRMLRRSPNVRPSHLNRSFLSTGLFKPVPPSARHLMPYDPKMPQAASSPRVGVAELVRVPFAVADLARVPTQAARPSLPPRPLGEGRGEGRLHPPSSILYLLLVSVPRRTHPGAHAPGSPILASPGAETPPLPAVLSTRPDQSPAAPRPTVRRVFRTGGRRRRSAASISGRTAAGPNSVVRSCGIAARWGRRIQRSRFDSGPGTGPAPSAIRDQPFERLISGHVALQPTCDRRPFKNQRCRTIT